MTSAHTNQTPTLGDVNNGNAITVGGTYVFSSNGSVTAVRFWAPTTNTGTYTVKLYQVTTDDDPAGTGTGTELASAQVAAAAVTAGAFNDVNITPVSVDTTHAYRAAVHCTSGRIVATSGAFTSGSISNGGVTAIQSGADPVGLGSLHNGTFTEGASAAYPASTFNSTDYFVDVVFSTGTSGTASAVLGALTAAAVPYALGTSREASSKPGGYATQAKPGGRETSTRAGGRL
jgi:hypothetical protein